MPAGRVGMRLVALGGAPQFGLPQLLGLPNGELYLDSRLGISGAHGSTVGVFPNQFTTGAPRDGLPDTGAGNAGDVLLQKTSNTSPNGQQTLLFSGADFPAAPVFRSRTAFAWPSIANGYTFYAGFNRLATVSSSGQQLLWNEGGSADVRIPVNQGTGGFWEYRDHNGVNRDTNTTGALGWQSWRGILHAAGTVDYVIDGATATWQGGWNQQWSFNPATEAGYLLGNLATNFVVGFHGLMGWFLWFSVEHPPALQKTIDNFLRSSFGLAVIP